MIDRRSLLASAGALAPLATIDTGVAVAAPVATDAPRKLNFRSHRFGVNYVPSRNWSYCWNAWDASSIARDLDAIASLHADHIRVQLIWPWFQPNPRVVSEAHLARLDQLMGLADERRLDVVVTCFNGWLSGYAFRPPYHTDKDFYTALEWAAAQETFLVALGRLLMPHANFLGFDIANEIHNCWSTTPSVGDAWMARMFAMLSRIAPDRVHVNGEDPHPWFRQETFSPQNLALSQPIVPIHAYPYWTGAKRYGGIFDEPYTRLASALAALVRSYAGDRRKPIWLEEFGASRIEMQDADLPKWMELTITNGIRDGISWFTWWGSHDVDRRYAFNAFEYDLGLLTVENRLKPQARVFEELARSYRGEPVVIAERTSRPPPAIRTEDTAWAWMLEWLSDSH